MANAKTSRTYPYKGWILTSSYAVKEITLVRPVRVAGGSDWGDEDDAGVKRRLQEIHPTQKIAVTVGRARLAIDEADIARRKVQNDKRRVALDRFAKAAGLAVKRASSVASAAVSNTKRPRVAAR